jgi:hypothetical protein
LGYVGWPEKSLDGEKGMLWLAGLVGWVGKIRNKFRNCWIFPANTKIDGMETQPYPDRFP